MKSTILYRSRIRKNKVMHMLNENAFILFIISLFWFLFRTGRKPTRIAYPCQKIAAAHIATYVICLLPIINLKCFIKQCFQNLSYRLFIGHLYKILILGTSIFILSVIIDHVNVHQKLRKYETHRKHLTVGFTASSGIFPRSQSLIDFAHRVVGIRDTMATDWDFITGMHWNHIDQDVVDDMVERGVMALTSTTSPVDAWSILIPYHEDEAVAIKVNCNNNWGEYEDTDNQHDAFPETVNSIIKGLLSIGIPSDKIWITDPSKVIPDRFRDKIEDDGVLYFTASHTGQRPNVFLTTYVDTNSTDASPIQNPATEVVRPAQVLVDAHHLINIPMMKGQTRRDGLPA